MKIVFNANEYEVENFNYSKSQNSFNAKCKLPTDFVIGAVGNLDVYNGPDLIASYPAMVFSEENNNFGGMGGSMPGMPSGASLVSTQVYFKGSVKNV